MGIDKPGKTMRAAAGALSLLSAQPADAQDSAGTQNATQWKTEVVDVGAETNASAFMSIGKEMEPPPAFYDLCRRAARICEKQDESAAMLTQRTKEGSEFDMLQLREINVRVNKNVRPVSDLEQHGVPDHWSIAVEGGVGDCEDYALLKRELLIAEGYPPSDLLITAVYDEKGEGHAVLTVRTKKGDFILDNKRMEVLLWSVVRNKYSYTFVMRQSYLNPNVWYQIKQ